MSTTTTPTRHGLFPVYLLYLLAFPLGMAWVEMHQLNGPTFCLFRLLTHLDCPGCGMTRAFRAMGRLDVYSAFQYNPLGPLVFLAALALWGYVLAWLLSRGRLHPPAWWSAWQYRLATGAIIIFLLAGIVRIVYELHHPPPPPIMPNHWFWWLW